MSTPKPRRPTAEYERQCLTELNRCTFAVGSPDKRFVRQMQGAAEITEGQAAYLRRLYYRYRRQMGLTDAVARMGVEKLELAARRASAGEEHRDETLDHGQRPRAG